MQKRAGCFGSIRRVISSKNTQLPSNWKSFVSSSANKDDLAEFLSGALKKKAAELNNEYELVIGGGFYNILEVWSSKGRDIENLKSSHEEADTRLILHANDAYMNGYQKIVLQCRDTDILILALAFKGQLSQEIWMCTGTANKRQYIPVNKIDLPDHILSNILAFHALTACDTVSQFAGKGKKKWPGKSFRRIQKH